MSRINPVNARQYKKLVGFCRKIFKERKYISQREFNLNIQQELSQYSTRFRKIMINLQLITDKNKVILPGVMLTHFKLIDYQAISRLQKTGHVRIDISAAGHLILYEPKDPTAEQQFPEHWNLIRKTKWVLMFNVNRNE